MKKFLILFILFFGGAVALFAAIVPQLISSETFKQHAVKKIKEATGYSVTIGGKVKINIFPTVVISLEKIAVNNTPDGRNITMMRVKRVNADIALMPLLHKEVIIKSLELEQPEISLHVQSSGSSNWEMPLSLNAASADNELKAAVPQLHSLLLNKVTLSQGSITYSNEKDKKSMTFNNANMDISLTESSKIILDGNGTLNKLPVKISAEIDTLEQFLSGATTKIKSSLKADLLMMDINGVWENNTYKGALNARVSSIKDFLLWASPASKPITQPIPSVLTLRGETECGKTYCHIDNGALSLDDTKTTGAMKASWGGVAPQLELDLATEWLDLNFFLPAEKIHVTQLGWLSPAFAAADPEEEWSDEPWDIDALMAVDVLLKLRADKVLVRNATIEKADFTLKLQGGHLSFDLPEAGLYGGTFSVHLDMEIIAKSLGVGGHWEIKNAQLGPLLKDAFDDDRLSGTLNLKVDTERSGKSTRDLVYNVTGRGNFSVTDGAFKGFNLAEMARNIESAFKPEDPSEQTTDFTELSGSFTINQGIISNNDLAMKSPFLRLTGEGQIDLPLSTVHYRLLPQLVNTAQGQGGKEKPALMVIPIVVSGSFDDLSFYPDLKSMAKDAIQNPGQVKKQIKDAKDAAKKLFKRF